MPMKWSKVHLNLVLSKRLSEAWTALGWDLQFIFGNVQKSVFVFSGFCVASMEQNPILICIPVEGNLKEWVDYNEIIFSFFFNSKVYNKITLLNFLQKSVVIKHNISKTHTNMVSILEVSANQSFQSMKFRMTVTRYWFEIN